MHCKKIRILLSSYSDHATSAEDSGMVEQHLQVCSSCRQELAEIRQLCTFLRQMEQPVVPKTLWTQIRRHLEQRRLIR